MAHISVDPYLVSLLFRVTYMPCLLQDELEDELEELVKIMKKSKPQLPSVPTEEPVAARPGLGPFLFIYLFNRTN